MSPESTDWLKKFIGAEGPKEERPRRLGRYEVLSEIGRGGTSIVYKAMDPDLKRIVALKVLRDPQGHPVLIERLQR